METISENTMFGGTQGVYGHRSEACDCDMRVSVFLPPQAKNGPCPTLIWLSGLTCTEENFTVKAGAQRLASELGFILVAPDTSPRGDAVPDAEDQYDFGKGAGFYLNATQSPWDKNYQMETYIVEELMGFLDANFAIRSDQIGIFGHSMGGHGALTLHLKNPNIFKTCSAFSPIVAPSQVPWGKKALGGYLGDDQASWDNYDASILVAASPSSTHILIDQGDADQFLAEQLQPELFKHAGISSGQSIEIRMQKGYDHSYFFIASFIDDHLRHHARRLGI